jgi:hypothetical protein
MTPDEIFKYKVDKIIAEILADTELLLKQKLITKEELLQQDFRELMNEKGYQEAANEFLDSMDNIGFQFGNEVSRNLAETVEFRQSVLLEYITGKQSQTGAQFKRMVFDMIDKGFTKEEFELRKAEIGLTDYQMNQALTTAQADVSRDTIRDAHKDDPNQRFKYIGGISENSSKQCKHLVLNQEPEGYTIAEIDAGIDTPYVDNEGNVLKIFWEGRVPNFNCRHQWVPLIKRKNATTDKLP